MSVKAKSQFQARQENQKSQIDRHGNFAEVVIRTTPEGTDMINFARLWEHILVVADRQTRGYIAKNSRNDFDQTRQDFYECVEFMVKKMQGCIDRHDIDLTGSNFVSRIAQRYQIAERKKKGGSSKQQKVEEQESDDDVLMQDDSVAAGTKGPMVQSAEKKAAKPAAKSQPADEVDGF